MKKLIYILSFTLISCNSKMQTKNNTQDINNKEAQVEDFILNPLHPYTYEFEGNNSTHNKIDYFYLSGAFEYGITYYTALQKGINEKQKEATNNYKLYSIYVYKETEELNKSYNKPREYFDGKNKDLIAYVRFKDSINDIFYILDNGYVVYDCVANKPLNFEFEE